MLIFLILLLFTSCEFEPPGFEARDEEDVFGIRQVKLSCADSVEICGDRTARDLTAISYYSTNICLNISDSSPAVALGSSKVLCNSFECFTNITSFKNESEASIESLPSGSYSLVNFIDVNGNSYPDSDEPFFCTDDVAITALKANTLIDVTIVRVRAELAE